MNKLEIREEMTNIANEEIPDQVDLWPRIQSEIQNTEKKSLKKWQHSWKPALAFCVFFLVTAASYFVYTSFNQDVSIPPQLVTEFNQTKQEDALSVTLEWAYLDATRASVGILTAYPQESEMAYQLKEAHLFTDDGEELPAMISGSGGSGGNGGGGSAAVAQHQTGAHINFDSSLIKATSQSVPLTLKLSYQALMQGDQAAGAIEDSQNVQQEMTYQFNFDFSLPYFEAKEGKAEVARIEQNGTWFEISQILITPSMTRFNLCYEQPQANPNWIPLVFVDSGYMASAPIQEQQPDVLTDGIMGYRTRMESTPIIDGNTTCVDMFALAPYDGESDLTITVDSLTLDDKSYSDEQIAAEKTYFAEQGFRLDIARYDFGQEMSGGSLIVKVISEDQFIGIQVTDYPDGMNDAQAQTYVGSRIFKQRINGPWQFNVKKK